MSRSAGRVLIRPLGDYDAIETYEVLDCVEYEGTSYLCKQTSTGNLPTNKTYWQKLIDIGDAMMIDGSNAENVVFDGEKGANSETVSVSKDAGDNQTVTIVVAADNENARLAEKFRVNIGNANVYYMDGNNKIYVTIDTVSTPTVDATEVITITAHLNEDNPSAISIASTSINFDSYAKNTTTKNATVIGSGFAEGDGSVASGNFSTAKNGSIAHGYDNAATGQYSVALGARTWAKGMRSVAEGMVCIASGIDSHAAGNHTRADYTSQFVVGEYNDNKSNTLLEVGNGASESSRNNAFEVDKNGYICQNGDVNHFRFGTLNGDLGYYTGNDVFHKFAKVVVELSQQVTLSTSADTTVTFTDAVITADSWVDPFTSVWGLVPTSVVTTSGQCVLTFAKAQSADTVEVGIRV